MFKQKKLMDVCAWDLCKQCPICSSDCLRNDIKKAVHTTNLYGRINNKKIIQMKTLEEFITLFAEQFDDTDATLFSANTNFRELEEWSSLISLSLIAMVDEEFDVVLKNEDIKNAMTIEDLYSTVANKVV